MRFTETSVRGAYIIEPEQITDFRGCFARIWCDREMEAHGLTSTIVQSNMAVTSRQGTLRGLHFQQAPHSEVKVVRCTRGTIFDVIVDLRRASPTYRQWFGTELSAANHRTLYVPVGCATGYLTLEDNSEMYYHTSRFFQPESASGVRFDDAAFDIRWPAEITQMSDQDRGWPDFDRRSDNLRFGTGGES